jgi:hypothetical protein
MGEPTYIEANDRERERLRALVERLGPADLARRLGEHWTVADALSHLAFWDARASVLASKLRRGEPNSPADGEPEDVQWLNDAIVLVTRAIPPLEAARLALRMAEEADSAVSTLDPSRLMPLDPTSSLNPRRASHRAEHLDEIEAALGSA